MEDIFLFPSNFQYLSSLLISAFNNKDILLKEKNKFEASFLKILNNYGIENKIYNEGILIKGIGKKLNNKDYFNKYPNNIIVASNIKEISFSIALSLLFNNFSIFTFKDDEIDKLNFSFINEIIFLKNLGINIYSTRGKGYFPIILKKENIKGNVKICPFNDDFLLPFLLLSLPLLNNNFIIELNDNYNTEYFDCILDLFNSKNINFSYNEFSYISIKENQHYDFDSLDIYPSSFSLNILLCKKTIENKEVKIKNIANNFDNSFMIFLKDNGFNILKEDRAIILKKNKDYSNLNFNKEIIFYADFNSLLILIVFLIFFKTDSVISIKKNYSQIKLFKNFKNELKKLNIKLETEEDKIHIKTQGLEKFKNEISLNAYKNEVLFSLFCIIRDFTDCKIY